MMKKLFAALMALMLLAAPLSGLTETPLMQENVMAAGLLNDAWNAGRRVSMTISLDNVAKELTGEPAVDQVINDLLSALSISYYSVSNEIYLAVNMEQASGEIAELLSFGSAIEGEDHYFTSNLIGSTVVLTADDVVPVLQRLVDMFVMTGFVDPDMAEEIKAQLPEIMGEAATVPVPASVFEIDYESLDYSAFVNALETLMEKMTFEDAAVQPENADEAAAMAHASFSNEEVGELFASVFQFIKDNPGVAEIIADQIAFDAVYAVEYSGVASENASFETFIDQRIEEIREWASANGDVTCTLWLDADGMPVAMEMSAPTAEGQSETLSYTRLTTEGTQTHSVAMESQNEEAVRLYATVVVEEGHVSLNVDGLDDEANLGLHLAVDYTDRSTEELDAATVVFEMTNRPYSATAQEWAFEQEKAVKLKIDVEGIRDGVDFDGKMAVTASLDGKELLTVSISANTAPGGSSIMDGEVMRLAEMDEVEFATWFLDAYTTAFGWASRALIMLPPSVMNLINTGF